MSKHILKKRYIDIISMILIISCTKDIEPKDGAATELLRTHKDTLSIGINIDPDTVNFLFSDLKVSRELGYYLFLPMVALDESWKLIPRLAQEIPTFENRLAELLPNGEMKITWNLRENLFWSDGKPVTAEDCVFTHNMITDPNVSLSDRIDRSVYKKIKKVEIINRSFVVHWKEPYHYYNHYLLHWCLPKHVFEPVYKAAPSQIKFLPWEKLVSNGPYIIENYHPQKSITLVPNPMWKGKKPEIKKIEYIIVSQTINNADALLQLLTLQKIDAISPTVLSTEEAVHGIGGLKQMFQFHFAESLVLEYIALNLDDTLLKIQGIRKALVLAIDRNELVRLLFGGSVEGNTLSYPKKHSAFHDAMAKANNYHPEVANSLIEAAGFRKKDSYGYRMNERGQKLEFTMMSTSHRSIRQEIEQFIQTSWQKIGVKLDIHNQHERDFLEVTLPKRKFPHFALLSVLKDPFFHNDTFMSWYGIPSAFNNYQGLNFSGLKNIETSSIAEAAYREIDGQKWKELVLRQQAIEVQEIPFIPLFFWSSPSITIPELQNWKPTGTLCPVSWNAEEWSYSR